MSFLNLFKPANVGLDIQIFRLGICNQCTDKKGNKNVYATGQCKDCLCFLSQKVKHREESCPRGKW